MKSRLTLIAHSPLHAPVATARYTLRGRPSWVLAWDVGDQLFEGEASPLEGFGVDSSELCHEELGAVDSDALHAAADACLTATDPLAALVAASPDFSSAAARFAFETCALGRVSAQLKLPLWQLLKKWGGHTDPAPYTLPVSAVLEPSAKDWTERAAAHFSRGVRTFKLKAGRDLSLELRALRELSARYGPAINVRIDPNQTWSASEVQELGREACDCNLQWLEDPTGEADTWRELESTVPLCADEILIGVTPDAAFLKLLSARYVALKPMALGGFSACLAWAQVARDAGLAVSISHLFDGPRALDACVQLAFAVQTPGIAPGLGLHAGLEGWAEAPRYAAPGELRRGDV